jgi:hypothetical protein
MPIRIAHLDRLRGVAYFESNSRRTHSEKHPVRHQNLLRTGKCSNGPPYAIATPEVAEVMAATQTQFIANGNQDMQTTAKPRVARGKKRSYAATA